MISSHPFGTTNKNISRIGLGTWGLGGVYYGEVPFDQGVATIHAYIEGGGRHIDTAYSYHQSEDIVGAAIKDYRREDLFITSKTYAGSFWPEREDLDRVEEECLISLRDTGAGYFDNYMIHGTPNRRDAFLKCCDAFDAIKAKGLIHSIGCSIRGPVVDQERLDTAIMAIESGRIDCIQFNYSIARQKLGEVFALARRHGVAVICRWVLESGMLAGKYPLGHDFVWPDTRNRYLPDQRDTILKIGHDIKADLPEGFTSPVQVAVAFVLSDPDVTGIILGSNTPDQAARNVELDKLPPLPADYRAKLVEKYAPLNDRCNPTGEFEHVDSPRRPLERP